MQRREFILGGAAASLPFVARAQQPAGKVPPLLLATADDVIE
jgi:hypothetical protein